MPDLGDVGKGIFSWKIGTDEENNGHMDIDEEGTLTEGSTFSRSHMDSPQGTLQRGETRKDDFWEALSSHYNYLMNEELITSCREASGELALNEEGVSPSYTLSFTEFIQQFNQLHDWLHTLQSTVVDCSSADKPVVTGSVQEELQKMGRMLKIFSEDAQSLGEHYPHTKDEINRRVNLLSNKWEAVEQALNPDKSQPSEDKVFQEVAHEMRCLRRWLRELESRLPSPVICPSWTLQDLQEKLNEQQVLQQEIESRSRFVKSLLKQCDLLCSVKTTQAPVLTWDAERVRRVAINLEKRWHALWLRSLEWQYLIEELVRKYKNGAQHLDPNGEPGYGDEPLSKHPRLSTEWDSVPICQLPSDGRMDTASPQNPNFDNCLLSTADEDEFSPSNDYLSRDIGIDAPQLLPLTNEKGVMVGTTGITELKAKCGGHFGRFEIIQDVGYSSESSTQLSNDERSDFIRVYSYSPVDEGPSLVAEYTSFTSPNTEDSGLGGSSGMLCSPISPSAWMNGTDQNMEEMVNLDSGPVFPDGTPLSPSADFYKMTSLEVDGSEGNSCLDEDWKITDDDENVENSKRDTSSSTTTSPRDASQLMGATTTSTTHTGDSTDLDVSFMTELQKDSADDGLSAAKTMKRQFQPLPLVSGASSEVKVYSTTKSARVHEWLKHCRNDDGTEASVEAGRCSNTPNGEPGMVDSSCDASGEYTTNDSDSEDASESSSQGPRTTRSYSLSKSGTGSVETVVQLVAEESERAGSAEPTLPRVVLRSGKKKRSRGERPWSVTELYQLTNRLNFSPFSTSESALNALLSPTGLAKGLSSRPRTSSVGVQKDPSSPLTDRPRRSRAFRGRSFRSDSSSEGVSGHSHQKSSESSPVLNQLHDGSTASDNASPVRRRRISKSRSSKSVSTGSGGSSRHTTASSGTENYHDCLGASSSSSAKCYSLCETHPDIEQALIQAEVQSSVSDQVWDGYQDPPYFSEPYSEQTVDEEEVKKLLDFGDDYRAFIGSHSDTSSLSGLKGMPRKSPLRSRSGSNVQNGNAEPDFDSDSDIEEFQNVLCQSAKAYQFVDSTLQKHLSRDAVKISSSELAELVATCQTNLQCLQIIKAHLHCTQSTHLQRLIEQWENLVYELQRQQRLTTQEQIVQLSILELRRQLSQLAALAAQPEPQEADLELLEQRIEELKVALSSLHEIKEALLEVKLKVHRLATDSGQGSSLLKDDVADLYRQWDDVYEQSGSKLTELNSLRSQWQQNQRTVEREVAITEMPRTENCKLSGKERLGEGLMEDDQEQGNATTPTTKKSKLASPSVQNSIPKTCPKTSTSRRLWRVLRAALPIQVALVVLYCVACLLEPHCCDLINNLHASFGPQVRYVQGPPPV